MGARMRQFREWWLLGAGALMLAACTDPNPMDLGRPTGSLRITTATTGGALDPDGYIACVDPRSDGHGGTACAYGGPQAIGVNGTVTVTVDTGAHTVPLMGVAANCAVFDNPRAVHASRGETAAVLFAIACGQPTLHVTTTTTGVSPDPDGYSLCIDPGYDYDYNYICRTYGSAIGLNSGVTVPVSPGTHFVQLDGVAGNCELDSNSRNVDTGTASEVPFVITCFATGSVKVTTATSGTDVPDRHLVCVDRSPSDSCQQLFTNDVSTFAGVTARVHTVRILGLPGNCTVSGAAARVVTVPAAGTVDVSFDVSCVLVERIAFSTAGTIAVIRTDGATARPIISGFAPAWSPDGARLAYECGQDICAINADGTGFTQLTFDGAGNRHPAWSPDGLKIAFAATHGGAPDLYMMAANGSGVVRVTQSIGFLGSPAWSPDGAKIAFDCRVASGNDDICVVNADGTAFARLTSDPARDYGAAWKPDGSTLAFATTRRGPDEIVLMGPAGGSVTRIGAGLLGFGPTWSPDGTEVAFVNPYTCSYYCYGTYGTYDAVWVAHSDGSNIRYLTDGNQPAWKPHP